MADNGGVITEYSNPLHIINLRGKIDLNLAKEGDPG